MASNLNAEDHAHYSSTDDEGENAHRAKRKKGPKACDVCRRKKSDFDPSGDADKPCVNCAVFKAECTFTYVAKKRRTQQAFIDSLQTRLNKLERLLLAVAPDIDINKELDESTSTILPRPRPPSPLKPVIRPNISRGVKPGELAAAFSQWRHPNTTDDDDSEDDRSVFIPDGKEGPADDAALTRHLFHGNSSGITFLQKVIGMKRESTENDFLDSHNHLNTIPDPWEKRMSMTPPPTFNFPPPSLMSRLTSIYFCRINPFHPLLHRPSFEAALRDCRHEKDPRFGVVTMLVCAVASRLSEDTRVLPKEAVEMGDAKKWELAGWDYYSQVHHRYRKSLSQSICVYDLQMLALGCIYLQGASHSSAAWQAAGLGVRIAVAAGIHRRRRPGSGNLLETEMWKRSFWSLVVLDRMESSGLGRPCAIWEEDIDVDLPLEIDDEYLTPEARFTQPPHKPSQMAYFNYCVKLSQILIGALRTIYRVNQSKSIFRRVGPHWEQEMVAALDSSLNSWKEGIPEHLRWDATRSTDDITFYQSALLHCTYNYVQIVVHRPYITRRHSRKSPTSSHDLTFPSLAICTNAARTCSHILDVCSRRGKMLVLPHLNIPAFSSAIVLLFNVWGMNKPGMAVRVDWKKQMEDVHICMRFIKRSLGRWKHAEKLGSILHELVFVGDFPLPAASSAETSGGVQGQKRYRDAEDSPHLISSGDRATTSSSSASSAEYCGLNGSRSQTQSNHSSYTSSSTHEPAAHITRLSHSHNAELSGVTHGCIKPDPVMFKQMQLQSNATSYSRGGGLEDQRGLPQGPPPPPPPPPPLALALQQPQLPVCEFQYDADTVLRSLSFNQEGSLSQEPQNPPQGMEHVPHADDVLTALDAVYLGGSSSALVDTEAVGDVQHAFDIWGSVPGGFQWDEWQQFTNVPQNAPPQTGSSSGTNGYGEQPSMWAKY